CQRIERAHIGTAWRARHLGDDHLAAFDGYEVGEGTADFYAYAHRKLLRSTGHTHRVIPSAASDLVSGAAIDPLLRSGWHGWDQPPPLANFACSSAICFLVPRSPRVPWRPWP